MLKRLPAILMRLWLAYLMWRFIKWGSSEGFLLCAFAFLEGARMIATAMIQSSERALVLEEQAPTDGTRSPRLVRPA
jgi:hypothetical protein